MARRVSRLLALTAAAAFPIMSRLLGDASAWLRQNRGEISSIIKTDMAELKADLPDVERGFTNVANAILQMAKDFAPFVHAVDVFPTAHLRNTWGAASSCPAGSTWETPSTRTKRETHRRTRPRPRRRRPRPLLGGRVGGSQGDAGRRPGPRHGGGQALDLNQLDPEEGERHSGCQTRPSRDGELGVRPSREASRRLG